MEPRDAALSPFAAEPACAYAPARAARLAQIRDDVSRRLSGHRLEHTLNVARACEQLACRYGVDPFEACAAGLLHDWDKKLPVAELWAKAESCGVDLGDRDPRMEPLLHGWTAAASLPALYPDLPPAVFDAVARHTVGCTSMTPLDMLVYVADMLEPTRRGPVFDELRALAAVASLPELFAACLRRSMVYLLESGRYVYPGGVAVWNAYCDLAPAKQVE